MSRRTRAIAFACAALTCAGLAATIAGGYRADVQGQLGPLRPVVVALVAIPAHRALTPASAARALVVRRVPARFIPPGALASPEQALGRAPAARVPAGSYLLAGQLRAPARRPRHPRPSLPADREPVEIEVSGAGALAAAGGRPAGTSVDVVVTTEPGPGARGHTYVAAEGVALLGLAESGAGGGDGFPGPGGDTWIATLALTRPQALRLIQAENFARQVRLIPRS